MGSRPRPPRSPLRLELRVRGHAAVPRGAFRSSAEGSCIRLRGSSLDAAAEEHAAPRAHPHAGLQWGFGRGEDRRRRRALFAPELVARFAGSGRREAAGGARRERPDGRGAHSPRRSAPRAPASRLHAPEACGGRGAGALHRRLEAAPALGGGYRGSGPEPHGGLGGGAPAAARRLRRAPGRDLDPGEGREVQREHGRRLEPGGGHLARAQRARPRSALLHLPDRPDGSRPLRDHGGPRRGRLVRLHLLRSPPDRRRRGRLPHRRGQPVQRPLRRAAHAADRRRRPPRRLPFRPRAAPRACSFTWAWPRPGQARCGSRWRPR